MGKRDRQNNWSLEGIQLMASKQEMIEEIVSLIDCWELQDIIDYAKDSMYIELDLLTEHELFERYENTFGEDRL